MMLGISFVKLLSNFKNSEVNEDTSRLENWSIRRRSRNDIGFRSQMITPLDLADGLSLAPTVRYGRTTNAVGEMASISPPNTVSAAL
jgi:hypothetical protein